MNIFKRRKQTIVDFLLESQGGKILFEEENVVWIVARKPVENPIYRKGGHLGVLENYESVEGEKISLEDRRDYFIPEGETLIPAEGFYIQRFRYSDNYLNDIYLRHAVATIRN